MLSAEREKNRRELTRLLTDALSRVQLKPQTATLVEEFIDNYEFALAYEIMMEELGEENVPAAAAEALKAAGIRMRLISN